MLHVTTEIGVPGKQERERRHFPDIHNRPGHTTYTARGRRYIPHNYGRYEEWRPHGTFVDVEYTNTGPDWDSRLRYLPHPKNPHYPAAEIWPNNWWSMRPYPYTYMRSKTEWLLDPDHTRIGMRCIFNGQHSATKTSHDEITHTMRFGKGRNVADIQMRNCIPEASPGDKSYQVPEFSSSFHKLGSTRPLVSFSTPVSVIRKPDTFVPLHTMSAIPRETYKQKEQKRSIDDEVMQVRKLDDWKPATPLPLTLPQEDKEKENKKER
ncbi:spermatogenesis-associated serine-rich protein 1-like [Haliotis asinina]|uniref:spermatogenesis-associated serine-rich protein 1-like n=1 Tax=Haliotis asinina TaxID=109174 RepID=UPI003531E3FE